MKKLGRTVAVAVVATVVGFAAAYAYAEGRIDFGHLNEPRNAVDVNGKLISLPAPGDNPQRLAPAVMSDSAGEFAFESEGANGPILHDPCLPIHWKLSTAGMPVGAEPLAHEAVESVAAHTGLVFIFDGFTGAQATFDGPILVRRDGWEYAPMVIGWSAEAETSDLGGDTMGVGGARITPGAYGDREFLRSGTVIVATSSLGDVLSTPDDKARTQSVIMHELGHVVGLDHAYDPHELMFSAATFVTSWGPGDLQGLAAAGAGPCEGAK